MATTITDGGAYLLVNDGVKKKYIVKPFDVDIIGTTHIEISDTLGDKVKIAYADITVPASANIEALKDTLSSYLNVPMSGVASEATLLLVKAVLDAIEANTAAISIDADSVNLNTDTLEAKLGDLTEAAPGSDTGSSGLNGRLQRVAQHLTTLIAKDFATQTTVAAILAKIIAAPATEAKQDTIITALTSILTELGDKLDGSAFAAEDFASENTLSAINAKLAALGQAAMAASMPVVIASNQTSVPVTEASAAAIAASASVLDDWDESDRAKVNPVVGSAGLAGGAGVDAANALRVSIATNTPLPAGTNNIGDVDVLSIIPGTAATNLGKAEDAAHASGDTGVMALAVRNDAQTVRGADNDYIPLATDGPGNLRIVGNVAHDAVDAGDPHKIGGQARTTNPAAVADADRVNAIFDKLGKQIVVGAIRELKAIQNTTITSSTAETTIVTAVASTFLDVYGLVIANTSATGTEVTIKNATAGTTVASFYVPANETRGFMLPVDSAIPQAAVNNNWTATCGTSVASIKISAYYVKNL